MKPPQEASVRKIRIWDPGLGWRRSEGLLSKMRTGFSGFHFLRPFAVRRFSVSEHCALCSSQGGLDLQTKVLSEPQ